MANPNIVGVTTINGVTAGQEISDVAIATQDDSTTNAIAHNDSNSDKVFKINALYISNVAASGSVSVDVATSDQTNIFHIAKGISVPSNSTLDVLSKPIYLLEGVGLYLKAGATDEAEAVVSYEEIS